jgi:hypothetical protein
MTPQKEIKSVNLSMLERLTLNRILLSMLMDLIRPKGIQILQGKPGIKFNLLRSDTLWEWSKELEFEMDLDI